MTHSLKKEKLIVFIKIRKKSNGEKRGVRTKVGRRWVWLAGWIVGTSWLSSQLGFNLVCKLPQVGYGLAQIDKLSVNGAGVCGGREGEHHTELLERRFHGFPFDKMTLVTAPAMAGIIPPSFLLYSGR
jgi:hypothetical protein